MNLSVSIEYESKIDELAKDFKSLSFLKNSTIHENNSISWQRKDCTSYDLQVIFIGKTGYGKSSTLNTIIGKDVFRTNDVLSCTKELYSAEYKINDRKPYYFSLCDLPGVGESDEADKQYLQWYRDILIKSNCVVYVLRADQRDFAIDEMIFSELFKNSIEKKKVILALNYADKIEPISRKLIFKPTGIQLENLNKKMNTVSNLFNMPKSNIIYYSAAQKYNVNELVNKISNIIKNNI